MLSVIPGRKEGWQFRNARAGERVFRGRLSTALTLLKVEQTKRQLREAVARGRAAGASALDFITSEREREREREIGREREREGISCHLILPFPAAETGKRVMEWPGAGKRSPVSFTSDRREVQYSSRRRDCAREDQRKIKSFAEIIWPHNYGLGLKTRAILVRPKSLYHLSIRLDLPENSI